MGFMRCGLGDYLGRYEIGTFLFRKFQKNLERFVNTQEGNISNKK